LHREFPSGHRRSPPRHRQHHAAAQRPTGVPKQAGEPVPAAM